MDTLSKIVINSFASGDLETVVKYYEKFGDDLFKYKPVDNKGVYEVALFYAFKNGHFNIINYYFNVKKSDLTFDISLLSKIARHASSYKISKRWMEGYSSNHRVREFLKHDTFINILMAKCCQTINAHVIMDFMEYFPEKKDDVFSIINEMSKKTMIKTNMDNIKRIKRDILINSIID